MEKRRMKLQRASCASIARDRRRRPHWAASAAASARLEDGSERRSRAERGASVPVLGAGTRGARDELEARSALANDALALYACRGGAAARHAERRARLSGRGAIGLEM